MQANTNCNGMEQVAKDFFLSNLNMDDPREKIEAMQRHLITFLVHGNTTIEERESALLTINEIGSLLKASYAMYNGLNDHYKSNGITPQDLLK